MINQLMPVGFELETNTVWSFPKRGSWATHDAKYRGNWAPYVPRNLLLRYSAEGELVLDQFVGGGTTLVEAKLLGRNAIGIDVNPEALKRCQAKIDFECPSSGKVKVMQGDARNLGFLDSRSIDFICTHPPYADIISYSDFIANDMSHLNSREFLAEMKAVASECFRVLKPGRFCAILIGDARKNGLVVPIGFETMRVFQDSGFRAKEIIIKQQHNCRTTEYWADKSIRHNFLLIAHEYLFVFVK